MKFYKIYKSSKLVRVIQIRIGKILIGQIRDKSKRFNVIVGTILEVIVSTVYLLFYYGF